MTETFKQIAASQYIAAIETLNQSVQNADDEIWTTDHLDTAIDQVVFHTLFFTDLYLHHGTEGFDKQSFHLRNRESFRDYEEQQDRPQQYHYEKSFCREYLDFCKKKVDTVLNSETESSLLGESGFYWRKCNRAELHIYNIRHIQHHAAQLGLRNQLLGGDPLSWVSGE